MNTPTTATVNISIDVPDLDAGVDFYRRVFGWQEKSRPFPQMAIVDGNNVMVCIHAKPAGSKPTPSEQTRGYSRHWTPVHLDFHVEDFAATISRAKEAGASIEQEYTKPKAVAFCSDPFGNGFCIISK
ncbi:putative enzyme related to lactoylglutathione lyase [Povalibacter uvarum]|uniref:Putative enzyme related to lactoylglutathione lyase n=1 Tax=Povalibacter uvarum TaxID=732238 RepID=A0A841HLX7_9GAMM|nr:VOC family protein [Povalibacter uvarum]MBB6094241.1 putative enzyme related to lactoylglutathione lyase [Povalibacter uvarum]